MKYVFFFISVIFGQTMFAQKFNGFFFEPLVNVKTTTFYKKDISESIETPYFKLNTQNRITPIGINVGVNLGYKFKNNNIIQLGVFQDESLSGLDFHGNIQLPNTNFTTNNGISASHRGGVTVTNVNALFKKQLFHIITNKKEKEPYVSLYLNLGITYFYKPNNGLENLTGISETNFYSTDSMRVQYTESIWVLPQRPINSFKLNAGIEFTFGTRKKELFNLGVSFITNIQSSSFFSFSSADVRLTDKNGNISSYTYHINSRGNGIYYQVSKRFYPFKWHYDRQQRKLNTLKKQSE